MCFRLSAGWTTSGLCPRPERSLRSRSAHSGDVVSSSINAAGALAPQDCISLAAYFGCLINYEGYAGALVFRFAHVRRAWPTSPAAASTIFGLRPAQGLKGLCQFRQGPRTAQALNDYVLPASSLGRS